MSQISWWLPLRFSSWGRVVTFVWHVLMNLVAALQFSISAIGHNLEPGPSTSHRHILLPPLSFSAFQVLIFQNFSLQNFCMYTFSSNPSYISSPS